MSQNLELYRSHLPRLSRNHQYDTVNISGSATAILGDVYHCHAPQPEDVNQEARFLKTLLDQLSYADMESRFQTLNEPYPDTFRWIVDFQGDLDQNVTNGDGDDNHDDEHLFDRSPLGGSAICWDSFADWLKEGSTPYWISGKLGTGKSTLMKFIVEKLSSSYDGYGETRNSIVISHFFWEPGSKLSNSVLGCLRTLLWQSLHFTESMRSKGHPISITNISSTGRLLNDLIQTIRNYDKTFIVLLDGLDECRETDDILDLVEALSALSNVKLCVSSRRDEIYVLQFSDFAKLRLQDLNHRDIVRYVRKELLENSRVRRSPSWNISDAENLANTIITSAEGVFLWVRLVIKDLLRGWTNRDDLNRMQKRLEKLPHDIYNLYTELMQREREDTTEYASDAAFYCQLLAQSPNRTIPLVALFFAVNDEIRLRYLDLDTVFNTPVTDLEQKSDLNVLTTWINVRTAGLLEVKIGGDSLSYCNRNRPGPCGRYVHFQEHVVGFIHRSAYTYLQDTSEGQKLLHKCVLTQKELMDVYFESQIVARMIVPGTYNFRFGGNNDFAELFPLQTRTSSSARKYCEILQKVCNSLYARGLMIATKDWKLLYGRSRDYPMSIYQNIDLCMYFAGKGDADIAEILVQEYGCQNDHQYMADVILLLIRNRLPSRYNGLPSESDGDHDVSIQVQRLRSHLSAHCSAEVTQSKEEVAFPIRLAELASSPMTLAARVAPIWELLAVNIKEDDSPLLPTSIGLLDFPFSRSTGNHIWINAALSVRTMMAWAQGYDEGEYSAKGRALFFRADQHDQTTGSYRIIDSVDSEEALECLRLMTIHSSTPNAVPDRTRRYSWEINPGAGFILHGDPEFILSQGLQQIFDRGVRCGSFVDCLRRLGKSEETIDYVVGERVRLAMHDGIDSSLHNEFVELLGSDPESLAPWIQKYPQLTEIMHGTSARAT